MDLENKILNQVVNSINEDIELFAESAEHCVKWSLLDSEFGTFGFEKLNKVWYDNFKSSNDWPKPGLQMKARISVSPGAQEFQVTFEWLDNHEVRVKRARRIHGEFSQEQQSCLNSDSSESFNDILRATCLCKEST